MRCSQVRRYPIRLAQAPAYRLERSILDTESFVRIDRTAGDRDIDRMGGRVAIEIAGRGERRTHEDLLLRGLATAAPLLMLLAAAMGFMGAGAFEAITRALCVGIVICPCALTIARPLAQLRMVGRAAARGIRVAEPAALGLGLIQSQNAMAVASATAERKLAASLS